MRSLSKALIVCAAVALLWITAAGRAQQPAGKQSAPVLKVQSRQVILPVTVRDKHGALVNNLTADDFTLTEDGRPQTIQSFTRESNLPFLTGLLVDTGRDMYGSMDTERKALKGFVDQMLGADSKSANGNSQAFLIHFDREVELLEDFTNSRARLYRELEEMSSTPAEHNSSQGPETTGGDSGSGGRSQNASSSSGTQLYDAIYLACDELMKPKHGRKSLIVISDGVDWSSTETLNEALDAADRAGVSIYAVYLKGEENRSGNVFSGMGRPSTYPGGGGWPGSRPSGRGSSDKKSLEEGRKTMEQIATQTGGRYFEAKKKENLGDMLTQIAQELHGQYLLAYTPDQPDNGGGYHKIALKPKNGDLTVATRAGYYGQ